jgi:hypothetical protein
VRIFLLLGSALDLRIDRLQGRHLLWWEGQVGRFDAAPVTGLHQLEGEGGGFGGNRRELQQPRGAGNLTVFELQPLRLQKAKELLNGLITNDKFCLTRAGRLRLSWPRARVRSLAPAYSSGDVIHRGGEHAAAAPLARPAHRRSDGDRPAALGSGLSAPPAMGDDEPIRAG